MRATIMYKAGDVRVEKVPDARLVEPTDAVIRIARACICGSDLWPYKELEAVPGGRPMGHEAIGVVEAVGTDVSRIKRGDLVVCRRRAHTEASLASARSAEHRRKPFGSPSPTAHSISCRCARMML